MNLLDREHYDFQGSPRPLPTFRLDQREASSEKLKQKGKWAPKANNGQNFLHSNVSGSARFLGGYIRKTDRPNLAGPISNAVRFQTKEAWNYDGANFDISYDRDCLVLSVSLWIKPKVEKKPSLKTLQYIEKIYTPRRPAHICSMTGIKLQPLHLIKIKVWPLRA